MNGPKIIAAIDPGLTGAVAWLDSEGDLLAIHDMPTAQAKQGKTMKTHLLLPVLADLLANPVLTPDRVVIEEVHAMPGQGVTSMFRFGLTAGQIQGVCAGLGLPTDYMRPRDWQKIAEVRQGKDAGRLRATQIWPDRSDLFARAKDHNRADAALIGYAYLKKIFTK